MHSSWKTVVSALAAFLAVGLAVVWQNDPTDSGATSESRPPAEMPTSSPSDVLVPTQYGVLYDDVWELTEGVWALTDRDVPKLPRPGESSNGLLEEGGTHALWINAPGLYGGFPTRVTHHQDEPAAPRWCEDVVEAPLRIQRGTAFFLGFEDYSEPFAIGSGEFRVRLCVAGLDDPLADPEAEGSDGTSTSRFRLQIWSAPWAPGEVVKVGSAYAREAHARS